MMIKRGKKIWIPAVVLDEISDIKQVDGIYSNAEAMRKMVKYTRVGREVNQMGNLRPPLIRPPMESFPMKRRRKFI